MPQPVLWVSATTPSTLGKSASMDVLARRDRRCRKSDDLAIAPDRLADGNRPDRDLVSRRNAVASGYAVRHDGARRQARARDQYAIVGMQSDDGWGRHAISPLFN